jgi:hypothetical protein
MWTLANTFTITIEAMIDTMIDNIKRNNNMSDIALSNTDNEHEGGTEAPLLSGAWPLLGHLLELRKRPTALMQRVNDELGEIGELNFAGNRVVMLMGEAQEAFFRATDEQLDQAEAYPFMKPVFGEGVVFDASPEERKKALKNQALRGDFMKGHATTIANEVKKTIRKVNALEKIAIPDLQEVVHYIQSRLEENERDMFVLMKLVKSNLEKKKVKNAGGIS